MEEWIRRAQSGDVHAARAILDDFVGAVRENTDTHGHPYRTPSGLGTQLDERAIRYLSDSFEKILQGVPADIALGVKPGESGRPRHSEKRARDLQIATDVARLILLGKKPNQAYTVVAKERDLEKSGIRKIYTAHKKLASLTARVLARRGEKT